jgi:hypothetical protein
MERAMSEDGLWERLHHNIVPPPRAEDVARKHLELYHGRSSKMHKQNRLDTQQWQPFAGVTEEKFGNRT